MLENWNRRELLKALTLLLGARAVPAWSQAKNLHSSYSPAEFKQRLRGPIVSIPTPFTSDFRIDKVGLTRMINLALEHGITIFELTAGDSQFSYLAYDEIKDLAHSVVDSVANRGMTIIGTGAWWTARSAEFARYIEGIGGTALQVLKPPGADESGLVEHYQRVADATRLPIVLHGDFPLPLLEKLAQIEHIVALKEDVSLSYYVDGIVRFGKRINCFSGGGLDWFLVGQPYGATAYFDSYATFAPEISDRFWKAVQASDFATETEIIEKYDHPFIQNFSAAFWHATLEYFGVAQRYLRPPQHSYSEQEMAKVKQFYDALGVKPQKTLS